jgi:histidinol-phosphate aminotransferase
VDLSDNTNLFGAPPNALAGFRTSDSTRLTRYPSLYAGGLKRAIARYLSVDETNIVTGCGSDDVLDSTIRALCDPGDIVATSDPSFSMIPLHARMNGLHCEQAPLDAGLDIDADALLAAAARVTYMCSPNNPTGTLASRDAVERVIAGAPGVVILDEAYAEFTSESQAQRAAVSSNVLVVRMFSKAFGLAGLRIGYAVGAADLVNEVEKSRGPFKVNAPAEEAATVALTSDLEWMREKVAEVLYLREKFSVELKRLGLSPLPSSANFVMVPVTDANSVAARMRDRSVAVREFTSLPRIGDALRISIGPWDMMAEALAALEAALQ